MQITIFPQSNSPEKQVAVMIENLLNAFTHLLASTVSTSTAMPERLVLQAFPLTGTEDNFSVLDSKATKPDSE